MNSYAWGAARASLIRGASATSPAFQARTFCAFQHRRETPIAFPDPAHLLALRVGSPL